MTNGLEEILDKTKAGNLYSDDIIRGFKLISRGDELQLRNPTGPFKFAAGVVAWPVKKALFKGDRTYDSANNLLTDIAAETVAGGGMTHAAVVAGLYEHFITYGRNMKQGDRNAIRGKRADARANYEAAIVAAGEMTTLVDTHMASNVSLKGYIAARKADAQAKKGEFQGAYDALNIGELANNEEAAYKRGEIKLELGEYQVAETDLRIVYDRNPKREGIADKLASTYQKLAATAAPATTDTAGIEDAVVTNWNRAMDLLARDGTTAQKAKIQEVIAGIGDPAGDVNKVSLLARAYHALAVVNRREREYRSAIDNLRSSVGLLPTPEAYTNLAETHTMAASSAGRQAR